MDTQNTNGRALRAALRTRGHGPGRPGLRPGDGEARASWAAAEAEHDAVARATEQAVETAEGHLGAVMDAAVGR